MVLYLPSLGLNTNHYSPVMMLSLCLDEVDWRLWRQERIVYQHCLKECNKTYIIRYINRKIRSGLDHEDTDLAVIDSTCNNSQRICGDAPDSDSLKLKCEQLLHGQLEKLIPVCSTKMPRYERYRPKYLLVSKPYVLATKVVEPIKYARITVFLIQKDTYLKNAGSSFQN